MDKKINYQKIIKSYTLIFTGSLIAALGINLFLVPHKIAPGGITGLSTVIYYLTGSKIPVGVIMLILNFPLFAGGMKYIGKRFTVMSLIGTILLSLITVVTEPFAIDFVNTHFAESGPDILLYAIYGGGLMGIGLGLVLKTGATTGGTDLAAYIMNNFIPDLTIGQHLMIADMAVIVIATLAFRNIDLTLYSIIALFLSSRIIDIILEGVNFAKAVYIISDKQDIIAQRILTEMDRGVTLLRGIGMYTGNTRNILFTVVQRGQLSAVKKIVKEEDDKAFFILTEAKEVLGEGFKTYDQ